MSYTYSDQDQFTIATAALAAADGQRVATWLAQWQTRLGDNPFVCLYRDGTRVYAGQITGKLPISGNTFVVPTTASKAEITTADIDTGSWECRIENAVNRNIYIGASVSKTGGTDTLALSADIDGAGNVSIGTIVFTAPALDTVTAVISKNDSRVIAWVDPSLPWASQPYPAAPGRFMATQVSNTWNAGRILQEIPEPGIIGSGSEYTFARVADPSDGSKYAILHRNKSTYPLWGTTARSSYTSTTFLDGVDYWLAFAVRIDNSWVNGGNWMGLFDIHQDNWSNGPYDRPSIFPRAPLSLDTRAVMGYTLTARGCYKANGTVADMVETTLINASGFTHGDWHKLVMKVRMATLASQNPSIQVWRKINNGTMSQIVDSSGIPIGFYDCPPDTHYAKPGLYQWDSTVYDRTTYGKGFFMLRDQAGTPTITASAMMSLLDAV